MEVGEPLVVRAVARLVQVEQRRPRGRACSASRPTRLVAWMYSAARLRLALHDHQAEPADVEADRDHVGRERDVDRRRFAAERAWPSRCLGLGHLVGADARGQLQRLAQTRGRRRAGRVGSTRRRSVP